MNIKFSNDSNKPIYKQLFERITFQIINGQLDGETILPPIRTAAKELGVSIITVKKAWEELEREGFIYTIVGKGCFVSPYTDKQLFDTKKQLIKNQLTKDLVYYKELGTSMKDLISIIKEEYNE
ncbi:MAG: GntR family transcriptional regulator [Spirochaetaceae bacterium]